jgi:hypothetical protein
MCDWLNVNARPRPCRKGPVLSAHARTHEVTHLHSTPKIIPTHLSLSRGEGFCRVSKQPPTGRCLVGNPGQICKVHGVHGIYLKVRQREHKVSAVARVILLRNVAPTDTLPPVFWVPLALTSDVADVAQEVHLRECHQERHRYRVNTLASVLSQ